MQFRDLKKQYLSIKTEIDLGIQNVIEQCNFINGTPVRELEEQLAQYVGVKHCIACGNGTDALSMALMAWCIGEGDAVFLPDFTFFATAEVVSLAGATPIFVDVDKDTYNISPLSLIKSIDKVLKEGKLVPKAIITVDLFGLPADYPSIFQIAHQYGLKILEDGAQGFGGMIRGQAACSFGDISTSSFFPAKPLGCYGDGGAIFTNDDEIANYLKSIQVHGKGTYKYDNIRIGLNSRLDTIQAAILLPKLSAFIKHERDDVNRIAMSYTNELIDVVKVPVIPEGFTSSWAQYTIQLDSLEERNCLQNFLKRSEIPSMIYYPIPLHRQRAYENCNIYDECPMAEKLSQTVLSLPIHPYLTDEEVRMVAQQVIKFKSVFKAGRI